MENALLLWHPKEGDLSRMKRYSSEAIWFLAIEEINQFSNREGTVGFKEYRISVAKRSSRPGGRGEIIYDSVYNLRDAKEFLTDSKWRGKRIKYLNKWMTLSPGILGESWADCIFVLIGGVGPGEICDELAKACVC
jgi:hypothetical protein